MRKHCHQMMKSCQIVDNSKRTTNKAKTTEEGTNDGCASWGLPIRKKNRLQESTRCGDNQEFVHFCC